MLLYCSHIYFFFFKQKTAYDIRISDWSSDVCSSDLFELNKRFGFTKFVIVVPSVAIKEGVYKTLQITEEHFKGLYSGQPFDYFLYDSAKLGQVRNFAT